MPGYVVLGPLSIVCRRFDDGAGADFAADMGGICPQCPVCVYRYMPELYARIPSSIRYKSACSSTFDRERVSASVFWKEADTLLHETTNTQGERGEIIASQRHFPDFYTKQALKV